MWGSHLRRQTGPTARKDGSRDEEGEATSNQVLFGIDFMLTPHSCATFATRRVSVRVIDLADDTDHRVKGHLLAVRNDHPLI